jgi:RNA-binding protein
MALEPAVFLGKAAVTDAVVTELKTALHARELIKVKLLETVDGDRHDVAERLAAGADAELVQVIGRNVLLYRRNEEKPRIALPS